MDIAGFLLHNAKSSEREINKERIFVPNCASFITCSLCQMSRSSMMKCHPVSANHRFRSAVNMLTQRMVLLSTRYSWLLLLHVHVRCDFLFRYQILYFVTTLGWCHQMLKSSMEMSYMTARTLSFKYHINRISKHCGCSRSDINLGPYVWLGTTIVWNRGGILAYDAIRLRYNIFG